MKTARKTLLSLALLLQLAGASALAQSYPPALPRDPPQDEVDEVQVRKAAEALLQACRPAKERELTGRGLTKNKAVSRAKDVCFCIAKDISRRDDPKEMSFLTRYVRDQFDDDHVYTEEQGLWLHEFGKTEQNCNLKPSYRFGQPEPRLPADSAIQKSLRKDAPAKPLPETKNEKRKNVRSQ